MAEQEQKLDLNAINQHIAAMMVKLAENTTALTYIGQTLQKLELRQEETTKEANRKFEDINKEFKENSKRFEDLIKEEIKPLREDVKNHEGVKNKVSGMWVIIALVVSAVLGLGGLTVSIIALFKH